MTIVRTKYNESTDELWTKIALANSSIKTTDIKGKDYAEVNQRVKAFRFCYPKGKIETKIISLDGDTGERNVLMRCEIYDDLGNLISTGYAEEKEGSTFINKTSFIENCETSAIGRALGMAGFGIDTSIASYEEVSNAIANQGKSEKKPTLNKISQFTLVYSSDEIVKILNHYDVKTVEDLPRDVVDKYIKDRKDKLKEEEAKLEKEYRTLPDTKGKENPFY